MCERKFQDRNRDNKYGMLSKALSMMFYMVQKKNLPHHLSGRIRRGERKMNDRVMGKNMRARQQSKRLRKIYTRGKKMRKEQRKED